MPFPTPPDAASTRAKSAMLLAIWAAILAVLIAFHRVLLPFLTAILIAYVIAPLVDRISALRIGDRAIPRWVAILAIYAAFFVGVYAFSIGALPQLYRELARMTVEARDFVAQLTPERLATLVASAESWLLARGIPVELGDASVPVDAGAQAPFLHFDLEAALVNALAGGGEWISSNFLAVVGYSQRLLIGLLDGVFQLFFILMVAGFILVDLARIQRFYASLLPEGWRPGYVELLGRVDERLAGVVRGQVVICLVNGVLTLIGLLIFEVKFALILATVATVLSFIPIFGSILSTIPIVIVGLSQSFQTGLAALAWIVGIHALEAYFLNPKIMGRAAKIHPAVVAFSLLAAERTFGFVGALFAVPVVSVGLGVLEHLRERATSPVTTLAPVTPPTEKTPAAPSVDEAAG